MTFASEWIAEHTAEAPPVLRERALSYVQVEGEETAPALAVAADRALEVVLAHEGGRDVALDLLAADGLITLALLAQAAKDPALLDAFAAGMMRR